MSSCELNGEGYRQEYPVFTAKEISKIDNGKGRWKYLNIGVFQQDSKDEEPKQIGEYKRNYSTLYRTFATTRKGDKFYALYSPDYTATRILEITPGVGIKDIGGEEGDSSGFCPIEFYIPTLRAWVSEDDYGKAPDFKDWSKVLDYFPPGSRIDGKFDSSLSRQKLVYPDGKEIRAYTGEICKHTNREEYKWVWGQERLREYGFIILPPQHAFVAGCHWGDDSSWKIQYIDVSRIDEGIIKRDDRFGYIELPTDMQLKDAIVMRDHDEQPNRVRIAIEVDYEIDIGALIDWNDMGVQIAKGKTFIEEQEAARKRWSENFDAEFVEMQARWKEQGERITREVTESGGKIQ